ncbi:unnamed protein product [Ectocarpus sp. 12 AP-2014]
MGMVRLMWRLIRDHGAIGGTETEVARVNNTLKKCPPLQQPGFLALLRMSQLWFICTPSPLTKATTMTTACAVSCLYGLSCVVADTDQEDVGRSEIVNARVADKREK